MGHRRNAWLRGRDAWNTWDTPAMARAVAIYFVSTLDQPLAFTAGPRLHVLDPGGQLLGLAIARKAGQRPAHGYREEEKCSSGSKQTAGPEQKLRIPARCERVVVYRRQLGLRPNQNRAPVGRPFGLRGGHQVIEHAPRALFSCGRHDWNAGPRIARLGLVEDVTWWQFGESGRLR